MTLPSPFETTRLPDLPPTQRLHIHSRSWLLFLRRVFPGILIGIGLTMLVVIAIVAFWPPPARAALLPTGDGAAVAGAAPTPAIIVPTAVPSPSVTLAAYWAPGGAPAGTFTLEGSVQLVETYRGWGRFRSAHMAQDLWAPIAELAPVLTTAQLAVAPEIAPTPMPTIPPPAAAPVIAPAVAPPAAAPVPNSGAAPATVEEPAPQPGRALVELAPTSSATCLDEAQNLCRRAKPARP